MERVTPTPCQRWTERRARYRPAARGAPPRRPGEEPGVWVDRALVGFRRLLHPGQHVYRWAWSEVPALPTLPYPRRLLAPVEAPPELVSA